MKKKILKISKYFLLILAVLLLLIYFAINTSTVQNYIADKVLSSISKKYNADWSIGNIKIDFMDELIIEDVMFNDQRGEILFSADRLYADFGIVNIFKKEIRLDEIILDNVNSNIYELDGGFNFDFLIPKSNSGSGTNDENEDSEGWDISIGDVVLNSPEISYKSQYQDLQLSLAQLKTSFKTTDFANQVLSINEILLNELDVELNQSTSPPSDEPFALPVIGWEISSDRVSISQSELTVTSNNKPTEISNLDLFIENVSILEGNYKLAVAEGNVDINDGIELQRIEGKIELQGEELSVANLILSTDEDAISLSSIDYNINTQRAQSTGVDILVDHSTIMKLENLLPEKLNMKPNADLQLTGSSIVYRQGSISSNNLNASYGNIINASGDFSINPESENTILLDTDINNLTINIQEAAKLWDGLNVPDSLSMYKTITLMGAAEGSMDNLLVQGLSVKLDDVLDLKASGRVKNIVNENNISFDVNLEYLKADIASLPIPSSDKLAIDSLGVVNLSGDLTGDVRNIAFKGKLLSDLGNMVADINLDIPSHLTQMEYSGKLALDRFDLGTLLQNRDLDIISIDLKLDGQGLDLEYLDSKIDGVISDFEYKGYTYSDIEINASIADKTINGILNIDDENVKIDYQGLVKLDSANTVFNFQSSIDTLNLYALGLYADSVSISADITAELKLPLRSGDRGVLSITDLRMTNSDLIFNEDSVGITAQKELDSTFVKLDGDFADISMDGVFSVRDIPASITEIISYYTRADTTIAHLDTKSKSISIDGQIRTLLPVNILMPNLMLQAGLISMNSVLDFDELSVNGGIQLDSFFVADLFSEKLVVSLGSESRSIEANIIGQNNKIGSTEIPTITVSNEFEEGLIHTKIEAKDGDDLPRLRFGLETVFDEVYTEVRLSDSLILNQKDWLASTNNYIRIYSDKILIDDLALTDNNEYLTVQSLTDDGDELNIDFKNFNIGQFPTLLTSKPSKLSGNINGTIDLKGINSDLYYLVNLEVEDMIYDSTSVGVLTVDAEDSQASGVLTTNVSLIGPANDVSGGGTYDPTSGDIDVDVAIKTLQMMLLDPFLSTVMYDSEGYLSGSASVSGTVQRPIVNGKATLSELTTTIVANNTRYGLDETIITFDNNSVDIGTIDLYDARNNVATVSGKMYHNFLQDITLDLKMDTDKFTFLNTSASDNPVFYGKMVLAADAEISGPISLLDVNVIAETLDSTEIFISPFSAEKFLLEEDFITYGKPTDFEDLSSDYLLKLARKFPFKVNVVLDAKQEAKMNFIIDPITGDKIEGQGNGNLKIKLNPDGQQEIFGTYTITDGAYTFSYGEFVSKDFKVNPGGTVKFNGDPLLASLDIDAIYQVYTTTYELIKNEISANENEIAASQRRTNVNVYLSLEGTLDQPAINLDIKVPEVESATLTSAIDWKLAELRNNPNELNNQVFGLLLFNSFILSDNAASGFGNLGSNIALSSVSSLISSQLNKLADKVVKGVDVDINVNSYDSEYVNDGAGGNVTEVGLKVSKQLFSDRLSVSAGGNFDLSNQAGGQSYSSLIGDFVLEYKLTESGRYRVRVFSKSDYDRLLNQNTNKNGVSLYFNRAFDSKLDD